MTGCRPCTTPIEPNHRPRENDSERLIDAGRYQRLVECFIYLSLTCSDIAYTVIVINQFMHAPTHDQLEALYRVLIYLKGCPRKGILYRRHGHYQVAVYTDADWADSLTNRRSMSGYYSFVDGELVTWRSKK